MPESRLGHRLLEQDTRRIRTHIPQYIPLTAPLTSTSWDGDAFSTTAKTLIDLSAVFGVPAGARAVDVAVAIRDAGSDTTLCYLILAPNNTAGQGKVFPAETGVKDRYNYDSCLVPCNADGDIYYQTVASAPGTMDIYLEVWGYWM